MRKPLLSTAMTAIAVSQLALAQPREPIALDWPAPEIDGATAWIQSKPLKLADLEGKVVVLHFWTHG